ncbi:MAG: zinc-ribbon domain-containing protein [Deltaproteobacteria bacterium]|nr:zinc-ribbon domain-containing protein [Deltaproteobacteria bacterium]
MELVCPSCKTTFSVADASVPGGGRDFPCPSCAQPVPAGWGVLEIDLGVDPKAAPVPPSPTPVETPITTAKSPTVRPTPAAAVSAEAAKAAHPALSVAQPAPVEAGRVRVTGVTAAVDEESPWRIYAVVGGTALFAILVVVIVSLFERRPPPPPKMPNPLQQRVSSWRGQGLKPAVAPLAAAVKTAEDELGRGTDRGVKEAFNAVRAALLLDPDAPAAIATYGMVLADWPDRLEPDVVDEALAAIASAIGDAPSGRYRAELEAARGWLLLRTERFEAARQAATKAAAARPADPGIKMLQAVSRISTRPEEAAAELERLAREAQAPRRLALWRGEAELRSGQIGRALAIWSGSLSGSAADAAVLRRLARLAVDAGDQAGAFERLQQIEAAGYAGVDDRLLLARLQARALRKPALAIATLDAALADPGLSALNRARVLSEKAAVALLAPPAFVSAATVSGWLDAALDLAPDLPELLYVAGLVDERNGAIDNALQSLEAAAELAPDRPEVALRLALLAKDDPSLARPAIAAANREVAHYVPAHLASAVLLLAAGDSSGAAAAVRRAADFDPRRYADEHEMDAFVDPPAAHLAIAKLLSPYARRSDNAMLTTAMGMAYYFAQDFKRAEATLTAALKSDPEDVGARLYHAILALGRKKIPVARRDLQAAAAADSQHAVVRLYQARLFEQLKKPAEAERLYRDLLEVNPLDTGARLGLSGVLWGRGQKDAARAEVLKLMRTRQGDRDALRFLVAADRRPMAKKRP